MLLDEFAKKPHRLVIGTNGGWTGALMGNRHDPEQFVPDVWEKILPVMGHDMLISAWYGDNRMIEAMNKVWPTEEHLYVDSGGYTLYRKQMKMGFDNPEFIKLCHQARRKLLRFLSKVRPKAVFELDNEHFRFDEDLLSTKNYCREEIKELTGEYPIPVFKMHQGFEYWKALCDSDLYPKLAIGGFAMTNDWHTKVNEVRIMVAYARTKKKWIHLLGCANIAAFRLIQPDSVDYSAYQLGICVEAGRREHPEWPKDKPWREMMQTFALYGAALALCRSHLYDGFQQVNDSDEEEEVALE